MAHRVRVSGGYLRRIRLGDKLYIEVQPHFIRGKYPTPIKLVIDIKEGPAAGARPQGLGRREDGETKGFPSYFSRRY